ncbi:PTS sugar transporter subunit IIA [Enterococcus canis]|uniref:PTS sugar transporter subunit IIA n=1 Tax=Enterococcus canis TaxID=214095 RepID=UPI0008347DCA|nr:PTS sugar transporter subunit IIA [Enterococcus canis]
MPTNLYESWQGVASTSKEQLFELVVELLNKKGIVTDEQMLLRELYLRETAGSTLIETGFAVPHIESNFLTQPLLLRIRLVNDISWEQGQMVQTVLFLFIRKSETKTNLLKIKRLMQALANEDFVDRIMRADGLTVDQEIKQLLKG